QVQRLPLTLAADRARCQRGGDEGEQDDLEDDQEQEKKLPVVGPLAAKASRVARHRGEHGPAQPPQEDDVQGDREGRAPGPHPRAVLLGDDGVPQGSRHGVHPTSSEVALRNASSRPPSTGMKLDTLIPAPVSAKRDRKSTRLNSSHVSISY